MSVRRSQQLGGEEQHFEGVGGRTVLEGEVSDHQLGRPAHGVGRAFVPGPREQFPRSLRQPRQPGLIGGVDQPDGERGGLRGELRGRLRGDRAPTYGGRWSAVSGP